MPQRRWSFSLTLPVFAVFAVIAAGAAMLFAADIGKATAVPGHRIILHVSMNDPATMAHAIGNADNAMRTYKALNQPVQIEIVANGAGAHMFRRDTTPVKAGIDYLRATYPDVVLSVCGITMSLWEKNEGKSAALVDGVNVVTAGIARIVELQEAGWSYIHP